MTRVELANLALGYAGLNRISSLDDPTENAKDAKLRFTVAAQLVLRAAPWPCALKTADLVEDTTTVNMTAYARLFTLPAGHLRAVAINGRSTEYTLYGSVIACDDETVRLEYISDVTAVDPVPYPAELAVAIAAELAVMVGEAKNPKLAPLLRTGAMSALVRAKDAAGLDRSEADEDLEPWIDA
jgi:hypothetical protein